VRKGGGSSSSSSGQAGQPKPAQLPALTADSQPKDRERDALGREQQQDMEEEDQDKQHRLQMYYEDYITSCNKVSSSFL
jgi:hypothetical protein